MDGLQREIIERFGFVPPFFAPAFESVEILRNLWQQTLAGYIENPLPNDFKLKLAGLLARAPRGYDDLTRETRTFDFTTVKLTSWPSSGSEEERAILFACVSIYLQQDAEMFRQRLSRLLPKSLYLHLTLFLSFNRMCLAWVEANPELIQSSTPTGSESSDGGENALLASLFGNYAASVGEKSARREFWKAREGSRKLDEQRRKLSTLFDQAPVALAMLEGHDHRFVFTNQRYIDILFNGREVVGQTVAEAMPEVVAQGFVSLLNQVYETGVAYEGHETPILLKQQDGSQRLFIVNFIYEPMRNEVGEIDGILAVVTDVTDEVRGREAIENQQKWLENLLDRMPIALLMIDPKRNFITFANKEADRLIMANVQHTVPGQRYGRSVQVYDSAGRPVSADRIPSARASRGEELNDEEYVLESGTARHQIAASSQTISASYGHERTALLILKDISAIRAAEEQFKHFTELAPQMPFIANAEGEITYFSRQWYEYTGLPEGMMEWNGTNAKVHHPADVNAAVKRWAQSVRTGEPYEMEYRIRRHDGEYRWHLGRATAVRGADGKILKWFGTNVDIHEQKMLQADIQEAKNEAEAANEAKSAFLANMSHEIRTPLGAILGFTDLLKSSNLEGEPREYLDVIERNGHALTRVIDDILDLSKVESGQMTIELVPFSLRTLVRDAVELFGDKANSKSIYLEVENEAGIPETVVADPARVRQILINLIGNAVKFTAAGGIKVTVGQRQLKGDHSAIQIRVIDTGPGMTTEQRDRLFQPFVQADNSMTRKFGGTGLGLALSRRLARALGGDVKIEKCEVDKGSTFLFEFDAEVPEIQDAPKETTMKPVVAAETKAKRLENLHILVVDDSPDNRVLMSLILRREGATVDEAADGEEAVHKATKDDFAVVLMDIQMPGMDGYTALATLKKQGYAKPVIALTAHAMVEERRRTAAAGFNDHVTKPVDQEVLIGAILKQVR